MTVPALLASALARDPGRPFITFYDEATGERVELSVVTTANWVAKVGNLLQDSLLVEPGTRVRLDLPPHWSSLVWHLACWSVGCTVVEDGGAADVLVCGPQVLEPGFDDGGADEVAALSLRPMAGRFTEPLPAGVLDVDAEVLAHGDVLVAHEPVAGQDDLLARGAAVGAEPHERLLVAPGTDHVTALLAALVVDGSLVVVRDSAGGAVADDRLASLAASERISRPPRGPASR